MSIKKILLVEDEKLAREGVRDFLISRGYLVTEAVDGEEAVKKFCESGQSVFAENEWDFGPEGNKKEK